MRQTLSQEGNLKEYFEESSVDDFEKLFNRVHTIFA